MRALTVQQPWASAIARGSKTVENRPRNPGIPTGGEWIAIHAGQSDHPMAPRAYQIDPGLAPLDELPHGAIVALAYLLPPVDAEEVRADPYAIGPLCIPIVHVAPLASPVAAKGALGLWRVPDEVAAGIRLVPVAEWRRPG